jgi:hypothetical protein
MNAIKLALFAALAVLGNVFAQTTTAGAVPPTSAQLTAADLPKELIGKWFAWSRGSRISRDLVITFLDVRDPNNIKGVVVFEDKEGCPAFSTPTPIEKLTMVDGVLTVETPAPQSCVEGPTAAGAKLSMSLRLEKEGAKWSAKGNGVVKSPARTFRNFEVQTTSP